MIDLHLRTCTAAILAALTVSTAAVAQDRPLFGLDQLFGQSDQQDRQDSPRAAQQGEDSDLVVRNEHLERQVRELTGQIEQLQFRNRQLEQQLQGGGAQAQNPVSPSMPPQQQQPQLAQPSQPQRSVIMAEPPAPAPGPGGRRADVFDPNQNPNAPGAPRSLGSLSHTSDNPSVIMAEPPVGVPNGRAAGGPLDLSTMSGRAAAEGERGRGGPGALPPPPARNTNATGAMAAVAPPSDIPKDYYDLAYGYVLRKDYAYAEDAFQTFLKKYPNDKLVPDAQYWLGESLFQRQKYDAAAEAFLAVSTKHASYPKAADSLLRLGQSLAALKQKEMACATLAEVGRKYPRASASVRQGVEREQKRVHC
jgi:tol-pal system protein YbgF